MLNAKLLRHPQEPNRCQNQKEHQDSGAPFMSSDGLIKLRQYVAQVDPSHAEVRILGCTSSNEPGSTREIRILRDQLNRTVLGILPERLSPVERAFLNGAIGTVRRVRATKADKRFRDQRRGYVLESIASGIHAAIVRSKLRLLGGLPLEAADTRTGMHQRQRQIGAPGRENRLYNCVRRHAKDVTAPAIAPVGV